MSAAIPSLGFTRVNRNVEPVDFVQLGIALIIAIGFRLAFGGGALLGFSLGCMQFVATSWLTRWVFRL